MIAICYCFPYCFCGAVLGTVYDTLLRLTSPLCDSAMMIMQRTLEDAAVRLYKIKNNSVAMPPSPEEYVHL